MRISFVGDALVGGAAVLVAVGVVGHARRGERVLGLLRALGGLHAPLRRRVLALSRGRGWPRQSPPSAPPVSIEEQSARAELVEVADRWRDAVSSAGHRRVLERGRRIGLWKVERAGQNRPARSAVRRSKERAVGPFGRFVSRRGLAETTDAICADPTERSPRIWSGHCDGPMNAPPVRQFGANERRMLRPGAQSASPIAVPDWGELVKPTDSL